jgi:hypothetical protein
VLSALAGLDTQDALNMKRALMSVPSERVLVVEGVDAEPGSTGAPTIVVDAPLTRALLRNCYLTVMLLM